MEKNDMMTTNCMQVPLAPPQPPMYMGQQSPMFMPGSTSAASMYPTIENHQQLLNPVQFYNGNQGNNGQTPGAESRPTTVFILNDKQPIGPQPQVTNCPHCKMKQISRVESKISLVAHFAAVCCCLIGCFCLAPLPYCMNAFKTKNHYCSNCDQYIGSYSQK